MRNFYCVIFAIMAAAVLAASATMPSDAAQRSRVVRPSPAFDGIWSVSIMTQFGDCNRGYRYPLRIVDGYVTKADADPSYAVSGAVARSGAIGVTVSGGGQTATGVGRPLAELHEIGVVIASGAKQSKVGRNASYPYWIASSRSLSSDRATSRGSVGSSQ
jgi:hypothetical protein